MNATCFIATLTVFLSFTYSQVNVRKYWILNEHMLNLLFKVNMVMPCSLTQANDRKIFMFGQLVLKGDKQLILAAGVLPSLLELFVWFRSFCQPLLKWVHKLLSRTRTVIMVIKDSVFSVVFSALCLSQLLVKSEYSRLDELNYPLSAIQLLLLRTESGHCYRCPSFLLN